MLLAALVGYQADDLKVESLMDFLLLVFSVAVITVVFPCLVANALHDRAKRGAHLM